MFFSSSPELPRLFVVLGSSNQSALNDVVPFVNNDVKADTVTSAEGESKEVSSLPQTGETNDKATKEGAIALGFASILAGLGFGYKRRH